MCPPMLLLFAALKHSPDEDLKCTALNAVQCFLHRNGGWNTEYLHIQVAVRWKKDSGDHFPSSLGGTEGQNLASCLTAVFSQSSFWVLAKADLVKELWCCQMVGQGPQVSEVFHSVQCCDSSLMPQQTSKSSHSMDLQRLLPDSQNVNVFIECQGSVGPICWK